MLETKMSFKPPSSIEYASMIRRWVTSKEFEEFRLEYGPGIGAERFRQLYALTRQEIQKIHSAVYGSLISELGGRFTARGCEKLNQLCDIVCPITLLLNSNEKIDATISTPTRR